jgi:hypothetical protein
MRNLLLTALVMIIGCSTDNSKHTISDQETLAPTTQEKVIYNGPCKFMNDQIPLDKFPINTMDNIELVSYNTRTSYSNADLVVNGQFKVDNIKQRVILNDTQADSLLSILYNINPSPVGIDTTGQVDCYNPSHSIVFYNQAKAIAFFEICFECGGTRQSKGVDFGKFCQEKQCILQRFFKANKVDFGIIDEMCEEEQ